MAQEFLLKRIFGYRISNHQLIMCFECIIALITYFENCGLTFIDVYLNEYLCLDSSLLVSQYKKNSNFTDFMFMSPL